MVGHLSVGLILASVLANVGSEVGHVAAFPTDIVTRELSGGIVEITTRLPNKGPVTKHGRKRGDVNLTGQNCASTCGGVAGTGPNQADCNEIIDSLNAQGTATFTMDPYTVASWVQASCTIEFVQSTADTVTYTYDYLGSVATYLSDACNAENGYAFGRCIFDGLEDAIWVGNTDDISQST